MAIDIDAGSSADPVITMTHVLDASRDVVWRAFTTPEHVTRWYGGKGFTNPICQMDVRPGGHWHHVMRTPDGKEHRLHFVFVEVVEPERLSWEAVEGIPGEPRPSNTLTLADHGRQTVVHFVARFSSASERAIAMQWGFDTILREGVDRMIAVLATL
ncbi:MAG: activator of HSP90 ATPase [Polyangiaceae bacterium]|nr:activator of HSP90 ATPase [Polyangiaceae bacterium]